jgi:hypothetical protein
MKPLRGRILPITSAVTLISAATAFSQEFFREFGTSRTSSGIGRLTPGAEVFEGNDPGGLSPLDRMDPLSDSLQDEDYNFRLGNVDFIVAAGLGVEFNDNINLAEHDRLSDIIFRPSLDIEGVWRISDTNRLRFGVGLSYALYTDHSEYNSDSVLISPNSAIAWTFKSGAFTITLRERLSYQEDPFDLPLASNVANFNRWENEAGIQVDWDANEFTRVTFGYDRYDLWAKDDYFKSQDRGTDTVYVRPSYQISPYVTVGLNMSVSWVDFSENIQADALVYMIGPYVLWKVSDLMDVYAEVGYQRSNFDGGTRATFVDEDGDVVTSDVPTDDEDSSSVYVKLELRHRPTENFRHKLVASKTTEVGFGSNFYDLYHVEYTADWKLGENTSLVPTLFYEYYETSGSLQETGQRYGVAVGIHHIFSEHLTVGLDYRFLLKDSDVPDSDYYQNLAFLSLYYKF